MAEGTNDKKWFSAKELAGLRLSGLPHSKQKVNRKARTENWPCRRRTGNGGGLEYHIDSLPERARVAIVRRFFPVSDHREKPRDVDHKILWERFGSKSPKQHDEVQKRLAILHRVISLVEDGGQKKREAVRGVAEEMGISPSTIYLWFFMVDGIDPSDWAPALINKRKGNLLKKGISGEARKLFDSFYLPQLRKDKPPETRRPPTAAYAYRSMMGIAKKEGWSEGIPSAKTMLRDLKKRYSRPEIIDGRYGIKVLEQLNPPQIRDKECLEALECVNMDGLVCDKLVRFKNGVVGKPVLVACQDVYSNMILGWRLGATENNHLYRLALADSIKYGIPGDATLDNSRAAASKSFTGGVKNRFRFKVKVEDPKGVLPLLGIKPHWALPKHPRSKPIERAMRDIKQAILEHPLLAGEGPIDIEIFWSVVNEIIKEHNARPGRRTEVAKGRSFEATFFDSYKNIIPKKATDEQKALLFLAMETPRVSRFDGSFYIHGNRYWNQKMVHYGGKKVSVRIDPEDLHKGAFVYDLDGRFICSAPCSAKTGYKDTNAARETQRISNRMAKNMKRIRKDNELLSGLELSERLPKTEREELEVFSHKVIEGVFRDKIEKPLEDEEARHESFGKGLDKFTDDDLRMIGGKRG